MLRFLPGLLCAAMVASVGTTEARAQSSCDRACLGTMLDRYLAAVAANDPAAAPLAAGFRQTENAIHVPPD